MPVLNFGSRSVYYIP